MEKHEVREEGTGADYKLLSHLFFRLLPYQVLLCAIAFFEGHGIDHRRALFAGVAMEEIAGNVVLHGFKRDRKKHHSVDIRAIHKDEEIILRIRDDCVPFDPSTRAQLFDEKDPGKNAGIRTVFNIARHVRYQNLLGLNVLTITI